MKIILNYKDGETQATVTVLDSYEEFVAKFPLEVNPEGRHPITWFEDKLDWYPAVPRKDVDTYEAKAGMLPGNDVLMPYWKASSEPEDLQALARLAGMKYTYIPAGKESDYTEAEKALGMSEAFQVWSYMGPDGAERHVPSLASFSFTTLLFAAMCHNRDKVYWQAFAEYCFQMLQEDPAELTLADAMFLTLQLVADKYKLERIWSVWRMERRKKHLQDHLEVVKSVACADHSA